MKNVPSVYGAGIQTHDPEHESTPITTGPGLPPKKVDIPNELSLT